MLIASSSCGGDDESTDGFNILAPTAGLPIPAVDRSAYPLKIVVSLPILADMARVMGGNQVTVTTLIPPGANPHTYVPGDDKADAVGAADIIFYNGLGFEGPTQQFIEQHIGGRPSVIDIVRNVPSPSTQQPVDRPIYAKDVDDDPHLFMDTALVAVYAETISHTMIIKDGANTAYYDSRFQAYKRQISEMHGRITQAMSAIPAENKALLVTQHGSLIWFAQRFGLTVAGTLEGDGAEAMREKLATLRPPAVFTETGTDPAVLTQLASEAGVQTCNIDTDSVADDETTYLEMMEATANEIARCLS